MAKIIGPVKLASNPSNTDDGAGTGTRGKFKTGEEWLNTTTGIKYVCIDSTTNAARWIPTSAKGIYVSPTAGVGHYNLLSAALAANVAADLIFEVAPGAYTETTDVLFNSSQLVIFYRGASFALNDAKFFFNSKSSCVLEGDVVLGGSGSSTFRMLLDAEGVYNRFDRMNFIISPSATGKTAGSGGYITWVSVRGQRNNWGEIAFVSGLTTNIAADGTKEISAVVLNDYAGGASKNNTLNVTLPSLANAGTMPVNGIRAYSSSGFGVQYNKINALITDVLSGGAPYAINGTIVGGAFQNNVIAGVAMGYTSTGVNNVAALKYA